MSAIGSSSSSSSSSSTPSSSVGTLAPPAAAPSAGAPGTAQPTVTLTRILDRVHAAIGAAPAVPARLVWPRPITGRGGEVAILSDQKTCLAMLPGLDAFAPASRAIAEEELARRYCIPRIVSVNATRVDFGNHYWDVETDRGRRRFMVRNLGKNVTRVAPDQLLLRDTIGNRYAIASLEGLDARSRTEAEKAL